MVVGAVVMAGSSGEGTETLTVVEGGRAVVIAET